MKFIAYILLTAWAGAASSQNLIQRVQQFLSPTAEFAGLKVNVKPSSLQGLGFTCEDGTEIHQGKLIKFTTCIDKSTRTVEFGIAYQGREAHFADGDLISIKLSKLDPSINVVSHAMSIGELHKKLDSAFARRPNTKDGRARWHFNAGNVLIVRNPPPINYLKIDRSFGMVLLTPSGNINLENL